MECITVQANPDIVTKTAYQCNPRKYGSNSQNGKLCSLSLHTGITGVVLLLLAVSFMSQLLMFCAISDLKNELETVKDKLKGAENSQSQNRIISDHRDDVDNVMEMLKVTEAYREELGGNENSEGSSLSGNRRRTERSTNCPGIPHFFLRGDGKERSSNNRFLWNPEQQHHLISHDGPFGLLRTHNKITAVRIEQTGVYYIFVQIKVNGRTHVSGLEHPSVGFSLKKNNRDVLTHAVLTQDERGLRYGGARNHPTDTISLSGIFLLAREDLLTIVPLAEQTNDHRISYMNERISSHFGGFLLEADSG